MHSIWLSFKTQLSNIDKISINSKTLVFKNEPLSKHTTFGVGGNAHYLILPCNLKDTSMIFKSAYKKIWVPVMGRLISRLIPLIEGKPPNKLPTYDIDGDQKSEENNWLLW